MKGEIILRRFNKVCKNLKSTTIDEILNDFSKIDSFNSLDEEEKKILIDIMYKFSKLCIKSNIDKKTVINEFKIKSNLSNNNLELKKTLQHMKNREEYNKNNQSSSEDNNNSNSIDIDIKIQNIQNNISNVYQKINGRNPEFADFKKLNMTDKIELLKSLDIELNNLNNQLIQKKEIAKVEKVIPKLEQKIASKIETKIEKVSPKIEQKSESNSEQNSFYKSFFISNNNAPKNMPYENWFGSGQTETSTETPKKDEVKECLNYLVNDKKLKLAKPHMVGGLFNFFGTTETNIEKSLDDLKLDEVKLSMQLEVKRILYLNLLKLFKEYQLFMIEYTNNESEINKNIQEKVNKWKKVLIQFNKDSYFNSLNIPNLELIEIIKNKQKYVELDQNIIKSIHTYNKKEIKKLKFIVKQLVKTLKKSSKKLTGGAGETSALTDLQKKEFEMKVKKVEKSIERHAKYIEELSGTIINVTKKNPQNEIQLKELQIEAIKLYIQRIDLDTDNLVTMFSSLGSSIEQIEKNKL
jgi:hypothetical protein